jgi:pimeloyl-ACP methyl ester carboxylesterase
MRHTPQHLMTPLTRRRLLQGTLGSVAGLAAWWQSWRRLRTAVAQPREASGQIRRGEATMATIVHQGITLAYEDWGAGEPAFVFVHGWACNRAFFAPQAEHFGRRHRVVSVDLRGHGESEKPQGPYPIAAYADDLAYLIEHLGLGKVVAVGHSSGGMTVLQLAAAYPDRVAAIVMVAPAPFVFPPELRASLEEMVAAIEAGNQEPRRQFIVNRLFRPTSDRKLVEEVLAVMMAVPSHVAANAMRGVLAFDGPAVAAQCTVPALHLATTPPLNPPHLLSQWLPTVVGVNRTKVRKVSQDFSIICHINMLGAWQILGFVAFPSTFGGHLFFATHGQT